MKVDEAKLIEKLRLIEALFAGAATAGDKEAADRARQRILERLKSAEQVDPPVEFKFTMSDMWSRKVFIALLRRYGIKPYRLRGQRYTTEMAKAPRKFVHETLWPEFQEISQTLRAYLSDVTERVVSQVICQDSSEAEVVEEPQQLQAAVDMPDLLEPLRFLKTLRSCHHEQVSIFLRPSSFEELSRTQIAACPMKATWTANKGKVLDI